MARLNTNKVFDRIKVPDGGSSTSAVLAFRGTLLVQAKKLRSYHAQLEVICRTAYRWHHRLTEAAARIMA